MNLNNIEYPEGIDLVWIGLDENGFIGAFITAGMGPIPLKAFSSDLIPLQDVENILIGLNKISEVKMQSELPRPDDFITISSKGIYVYDWSDIHRSSFLDEKNAYEIMAIPSNPIKVNDLNDNKLKDYLGGIILENVIFSCNSLLNVRDKIKCINSNYINN